MLQLYGVCPLQKIQAKIEIKVTERQMFKVFGCSLSWPGLGDGRTLSDGFHIMYRQSLVKPS